MTTGAFQSSTPRKWYEIWRDVWSHPGLATFQALLNEPDHSTTRGLIWIAAAALVTALLTGISTARSFESTQYSGFGFVIYYLCIIILTPIFSIVGIIIATAIYHGISRLFGGSGLWSNYLFCFAAVSAPAGIIGGVVGLIDYLFISIGASPLVVIMSLVSFGLAIYVFILNIYALRAVENIGTGPAVITIFVPLVIGFILSACIGLLIIPAIRIPQ